MWEIFLPHVGDGDLYKYEVLGCDGIIRIKADPFAFRAELRPQTASVVQRLLPGVAIDDERRRANALDAPISIYEVHLGSWQRKADGNWLSYRELAERLIPYVAEHGFTHIELMPIQEHPFDGSWGYQPTGPYAPTSRFGTPEDFRAFTAAARDAGIGVILDWVPAHFPADPHGLARFDGSHLYEHADPREGFHQDWNTLIYNYGRAEVRNYLTSNALYWIERFGIDGLRVDAVASMLYRDYSRKEGEWVPNRFGGRENLEAIDFLRRMNHLIGTQRPEAITLAEESTAFPQVSRPPSPDLQSGGLGFSLQVEHGLDERRAVLHGEGAGTPSLPSRPDPLFAGLCVYRELRAAAVARRSGARQGSLLAKMPGDDWQKFANLRLLYGFMWGHPGKKLLFMGCEFAPWQEWNADESLPWHLTEHAPHAGMQRLVRDLNLVLRAIPRCTNRTRRPKASAGSATTMPTTRCWCSSDARATGSASSSPATSPRWCASIGASACRPPVPGTS